MRICFVQASRTWCTTDLIGFPSSWTTDYAWVYRNCSLKTSGGLDVYLFDFLSYALATGKVSQLRGREHALHVQVLKSSLWHSQMKKGKIPVGEPGERLLVNVYRTEPYRPMI